MAALALCCDAADSSIARCHSSLAAACKRSSTEARSWRAVRQTCPDADRQCRSSVHSSRLPWSLSSSPAIPPAAFCRFSFSQPAIVTRRSGRDKPREYWNLQTRVERRVSCTGRCTNIPPVFAAVFARPKYATQLRWSRSATGCGIGAERRLHWGPAHRDLRRLVKAGEVREYRRDSWRAAHRHCRCAL
jgi:hypothetical protein